MLSTTRVISDIIREILKSTELKQYAQEISKIVPKIIEKQPDFVLSQEKELKIFNENKESIEKEFNTKILIVFIQKTLANKLHPRLFCFSHFLKNILLLLFI